MRIRKKEALGIWTNLYRWTAQVEKIFAKVEKLSPLASPTGIDGKGPLDAFPHPLSSPSALLTFLRFIDLPRFDREIKRYRTLLHQWEKENGKSRRVFAHNDAQYGNLLMRVREDVGGTDEVMKAEGLQFPHEMIIVVLVPLPLAILYSR